MTTTITNARALSANRVRLDFSAPLDYNHQLLDRSNYTIEPTGNGVTVAVLKVREPYGQAPTFIELDVTEMTDDAAYDASVNSGSSDPITSCGSPVSSTPKSFTGMGEIPYIVLVIATSLTTAEVRFSEVMRSSGDIADVDSYSFDLGLTVESVSSISGNVVTLITSEQTAGTLYTATIDGLFEDGSKNPLSVPAESPMLGFIEIPVEPDALQLRIYNFLIQGLRDEDQRSDKFLERFLEGPQTCWSITTGILLSIPLLWSITEIPDEYVSYLKNIVGWTDDLDAIVDSLDSSTLRRLIASSVAFWKSRGTETSIADLLRLILAERLRVVSWFQVRLLVGETEWTQEYEGHDSWIVPFRNFDRNVAQILDSLTATTTGAPDYAYSGEVASAAADGLLVLVSTSGSVVHALCNGNPMRQLYKLEIHNYSEAPGHPQLHVGEHSVFWHGSVHAGESYEIKCDEQSYVCIWEFGNMRSVQELNLKMVQFPNGGSALESGIASSKDGETVALSVIARGSPSAPTLSPIDGMSVIDSLTTSNTALRNAILESGGLRSGKMYGWDAVGCNMHSILMAMSIPGSDSGLYESGDEGVFNVRIVDSGELDRRLAIELLKLMRSVGERIEVSFISFLDEFTTNDDNSQWTNNAIVEDGHMTVVYSDPETYVSLERALDWSNYVFALRLRFQGNSAGVRFYRSGPDDYYEAYLDTSTNTVVLRTVVAGTPTTLGTADMSDFGIVLHNDVWYGFRVEVSPDSSATIIKLILDNEQILVESDSPADHSSGTVGVAATGTVVEVDIAELFLNPLGVAYIQLGNVVEANFDM